MTAMAAVGAALGTVLFALLVRVVPPRTSALVQLGQFDARRATPNDPHRSAAGNAARGWERAGRLARAAAALAAELDARGVAAGGLRQDLTLTGRSLEAVLARQLLGFAAGFLLTAGTAAGLGQITGLDLPVP